METPDETRLRFAKKERVFELTKASGKFPASTCPECVNGCCKRDWHHVGDCCIHCGNDEREDFRKLETK